MNLFNFVNNIAQTPLLAWAILVFFVDICLKSLHQRTLYIPRLYLIPAIMLIVKFPEIIISQITIALACVCIFIGSVPGALVTQRTRVTFDHKAWEVILPGCCTTFAALAAFFIAELSLNYFAPENTQTTLQYALTDVIISSLFTGYFLGRALCFSYRFYTYKRHVKN